MPDHGVGLRGLPRNAVLRRVVKKIKQHVSAQRCMSHANHVCKYDLPRINKWQYQQVCVQLPTYADNVALPAFARRTPLLQQSINISCPPGSQQQTCTSGFAAVRPCWDRQTDRRTDRRTPYGFIEPAPHIMRAVLIIGDRSVTVHEYYNFGDHNALSSKMLCIIIRPGVVY